MGLNRFVWLNRSLDFQREDMDISVFRCIYTVVVRQKLLKYWGKNIKIYIKKNKIKTKMSKRKRNIK